jgi:hypothetical protein
MLEDAPRAARLAGADPGSGRVVGHERGTSADRAAARRAVPGGDRSPGDLVLGRYELVRIVGRGGAGTVWEAVDRNLGRVVAVKCLPSDGGQRALAEARAAARLGHPTVVGTYGLGTADGCAWLVTEFVAGDTLRRTIAEDTHADDELLQIGIALCVALRHAHSRGIVHRDVTPRNVLVPVGAFAGDDPRRPCPTHVAPAKLADFGIARLKESPEETRHGRIVGTLSYMAPERLQGAPGDESSDLWALAVILHEAFVGEHPAGKPDRAGALVRTHTELPSLAPRRPDLPAGVVAAIDRAASPVPADRGTVSGLEEALRSGLAERGVALAPVLREAPPRGAAGRPRVGGGAAPRRSPGPSVARARAAAFRRPALLPAAPAATALGAAVGPAALLFLLVGLVAAAVVGRGSGVSASVRGPRVAAGIAVLCALAAAAGVLVPALLHAVGAPAVGPVGPAVAFLVTAGAGACVARTRAPRSIRSPGS